VTISISSTFEYSEQNDL